MCTLPTGAPDVGRLLRWCHFWLEEFGIVHHHQWTDWKAADVRNPMAGSYKICVTCHRAKASRA